MSTWDDVRRILKEDLLPLVREPLQVQEWIDRLPNSSSDSQRLAVSLAIDFASEAYEDDTKAYIAQIVDAIDYSLSDRAAEFGRKRMGHPECGKWFCKSQFHANGEVRPYVSVIVLEKFIACAGASFGFANTAQDKDFLRWKYGPGFQPRHLAGYGDWWTAQDRIVWVTCAQRFKDKWPPNASNVATEVKDALGLPTPAFVNDGERLEYVAVHYPADFRCDASQPTSLDGWWNDAGQWYLSYGKLDAWGRAQSITGKFSAPHVERVHWPFQLELGREYSLWYLGVAITEPGDPDRVVNEGLDIFEKILAAQATP